MIYLIFAILFSASLALALRISETFSDNRYGILVGNYVTCLVVAFILLPDKNIFAAGSRTAGLTGIVHGFLFTGNLVLMQKWGSSVVGICEAWYRDSGHGEYPVFR